MRAANKSTDYVSFMGLNVLQPIEAAVEDTMKSLALTVAGCVSSLLIAIGCYAQDTMAKDVYKKAAPSVMVVIALDENDQPIRLGTGFYTRADLVATSLHVVRNAKKVRVFDATDQKERKLKGVYAISAEHDLAALQMTDTGQPLPTASDKLEPGDSVFSIGNPQGLEATLSTGIVSAVRTMDKTAMYQITAPISPGSSGGPVLNAKMQVVGIATSYEEDGQNLNFAVDAKHLTDLVASNPKNEVRSIDILSSAPPSNAEKRKTALETVRVVSPELVGMNDHIGTDDGHGYRTNSTYKLSWDVSFKNDGDKAVKNFALLILIYNKEDHEMIHFVRKIVGISVPPKLARRTHFEEGGLDFNTNFAGSNWECEYRILDFEYDE